MQLFFLSLLFLLPALVRAHVGYVVSGTEQVGHTGFDFNFFLHVFSDFSNIVIMLVTVCVSAFLYYIGIKSERVRHISSRIETHTATYTELLPWMLRLSLGIALIGAGTSGALISPIVSIGGALASFQILVGFLLLSGFFTGLATLLAVFFYFVALFSDFYILGNLDFLGIAFALLLLGDSRPGIDDIFGIPFFPSLVEWKRYSIVFVRMGIGIAMTFLAIYEKFLNPHMSALVVEKFNMTSAIPVSPEMWVFSAGVIELVVGLLLIIGWRLRLTSAIAFIVLTASFFFFKESVYSHITLFGSLSVLFASGGAINEQTKTAL